MYSEQQVIDLLEDLRLERFRIGVGQHIQVQDLLLALTADRGLPPPDTLHRYLAPLLCKSPDELARFPGLLQRWTERHAEVWKVEGRTRTAEIAPSSGVEQISVTTGSTGRRYFWRGLSTFTFGLIVIALIVIFLPPELVPKVASRPELPNTAGFLDRLFNGIELVAPWVIVVALAGLALRIARSFWRPMTMAIRRRFGPLPAGATELPLLANRAALTDWLRKEVLQLSREQAAALGQQRAADREILDIPATVNATARRGGCLDLRKRRMNQRPAYVFLMEQLHPQDQQFCWFRHWETEFRRQGLHVDTFVFSGDPRICWRPGSSETLHLAQLAAQLTGERLLLFSEGAGLYEPITGRLHPWVRDSELNRWCDRVLLTPLDPHDWGGREQQFVEAGFVVVPSTEPGLAALVQWLGTGSGRLEVHGGARRLPAVLADAGSAWGDIEPPDDIDQLHRLIGELRSYLGPNGFRWFAACAAYPVLRWEFVLELGRILLGDQDAAVHVQSLVRLPWMRRGAMPDWFRLRLLNELSKAEQSEARSAAQLVLDRTRAPGVEVPDLIFPVVPEVAVEKGVPITGATSDFVSIGFVGGMSADQLTLRAPSHWRAAMAPGAHRGWVPAFETAAFVARERPSGLRVFLFGLLMTVSIGFRLTEFLHLSLSLSWFLPLLAAWLAHWHGLGTLRAWWPLAFLPSVGVTLGTVTASVGASLSTLLLALVIAGAVDRRTKLPPLVQWLRRGARWPAVVAFCLLVVAALEYPSWRLGDFRINLLAIVPALLLLVAVRWELAGGAVGSRLRGRLAVVLSMLVAAIMLSALVVSGTFRAELFSFRVGSLSPSSVLPIICFGLGVFRGAGLGTITGVLAAGLVVERLLVLAGGGSLGPMSLSDDWSALGWDVLFGSFAAALAGRVFGPFLGQGEFETPFVRPMRTLLLALIATLMLTPLFSRYAGIYGATLWIMAAVAFAAGVHWRERSLVFVPALMQFLYLFAARVAPAGMGSHPSEALAVIGLVTFPYAFCGAFFSRSRDLSPLDRTISAAGVRRAQGGLTMVDATALGKVVGQVDRAAILRSFAATAAPFVVLWQLFELYAVPRFVQQAADAFRGGPVLEGWHYVIAALLACIPLALAFWDWLDRRDSLRVLALVTGCVVGAWMWQVVGASLGLGINLLAVDEPEAKLIVAGLALVMFLLVGSGLLAGTGNSIARVVFLVCSGFSVVALAAAVVAGHFTEGIFGSIELFTAVIESLLLLGGLVVVTVVLARFVSLCLVLAGDKRRELLFGKRRAKGFWVRMAATSGLPSSCWRLVALKEPAFWTLFSARFLVYTGGVVASTWMPVGAALVVLGHLLFRMGKRLSSREMWRARSVSAADRPILFLRGVDDDQCDFRRPAWNLLSRWLDLWSFRRNLDEVMVDELAQLGPVVALRRTSDERSPFGAMRHHATDAEWQRTLADVARAARAIVLVASDSPSVKWEYDLLKEEGLLGKVLLLFPPGRIQSDANRNAAERLFVGAGEVVDELVAADAHPVSIRKDNTGTILLHTRSADAAAYVLALRLHFLDESASRSDSSARAPREWR